MAYKIFMEVRKRDVLISYLSIMIFNKPFIKVVRLSQMGLGYVIVPGRFILKMIFARDCYNTQVPCHGAYDSEPSSDNKQGGLTIYGWETIRRQLFFSYLMQILIVGELSR